ncbi:MAG: hypothetical protein WCV50_06630 [Patescibacteria group bacterium]|jgi:hypothetical protein
MHITPFIFLIVYLIGVALFVLLFILNVYHILRYSHLSAPTIITTFVFLGLIVGIVAGTMVMLDQVKWQEPINFSLPFVNSANDQLK